MEGKLRWSLDGQVTKEAQGAKSDCVAKIGSPREEMESQSRLRVSSMASVFRSPPQLCSFFPFAI